VAALASPLQANNCRVDSKSFSDLDNKGILNWDGISGGNITGWSLGGTNWGVADKDNTLFFKVFKHLWLLEMRVNLNLIASRSNLALLQESIHLWDGHV